MILLAASCSSSKKIRKSDQTVDKIIRNARSFTGTPYKWGGTTRSGMDCSGLLVSAFQSAGVALPRTTSEQVKLGKDVSLKELLPGDLVFFATAKRKKHKITHVGLVTEIRDNKNIQFIHATTKLGVIEDNVFSNYYQNIFVKARRIF